MIRNEIYIGYVRRSTSGQNTDYQVMQIKNYCKTIRDNNIFKDTVSGYEHNRPGLNKLLHTIGDLRSFDKDTPIYLVVTSIDRLSRDKSHFSNLFRYLDENNVILRVLNIGVTLINNNITDNIYNIIEDSLVAAEVERDNIKSRCAAGRLAKRQKGGVKEGRPKKYTIGEINNAMELLKTHSYSEVEKITSISRSTLKREKRNRKYNINNECICEDKCERSHLIVEILGHSINCNEIAIHRGTERIIIDKDNITVI